MKNKLLESIDSSQMRDDHPNLAIGQNVKVNVRIREGNKERIQVFEGLIIGMKGSGASQTVIVRKISYGIGVERTFLVNSPIIASIQVLRVNKIRRSKLYYMRDRKGKSARMKEIIAPAGSSKTAPKKTAEPKEPKVKKEKPAKEPKVKKTAAPKKPSPAK